MKRKIACGMFIASLVGILTFALVLDNSESLPGIPRLIWCGGYTLKVNLQSSGGKEIRSILCETFPAHQETVEIATNVKSRFHLEPWTEKPKKIEGSSFDVMVALTGSEPSLPGPIGDLVSWSGIGQRESVSRPYLGLIVEYADGEKFGKWKPIPDRKTTEQITIVVP